MSKTKVESFEELIDDIATAARKWRNAEIDWNNTQGKYEYTILEKRIEELDKLKEEAVTRYRHATLA